MNVILLERIGNLGNLGDEVNVRGGFARNYLIPQGKAVRATPENRQQFEARREELERAAAERTRAAEDRAVTLQGTEITIAARAGDEGRLYGSVGTREIAEALTALGKSVDKSEVRLPEGAIRQTGEYAIDIQLHGDITATIDLVVIPE